MGATRVKNASIWNWQGVGIPFLRVQVQQFLKAEWIYFAACIIYKEHSWEEIKSSHLSEKLVIKVVIKLICNHKAT